jgi:Co/Zn/Cd efflux system component
MRSLIESDGDRLKDLHLWRLGPGHLGAILSIATTKQRSPDHYRRMLDRFRALSHVTVEIEAR